MANSRKDTHASITHLHSFTHSIQIYRALLRVAAYGFTEKKDIQMIIPKMDGWIDEQTDRWTDR